MNRAARLRRSIQEPLLLTVTYLALGAGAAAAGFGWLFTAGPLWLSLFRPAVFVLLYQGGRAAWRRKRRRDHPPLRPVPRLPGQAVVVCTCGCWRVTSNHIVRQAEALHRTGALHMDARCPNCGRRTAVRAVRYGPE